jgi:glutamate dehydrogenase (NAD(P)+)
MMAKNVYETALRQFDRAVQHLDLNPGMVQYLRVPKRELCVNFPVEMDDESVRMFTGYRVQHSTALGPTKGGIRYHPQATLDEMRALAMWMTWNGRGRHPYGGRKVGSFAIPSAVVAELENSLVGTDEISVLMSPATFPTRRWHWRTRAGAGHLFWHHGFSVPAVVTGKPLAIGGSQAEPKPPGGVVVTTIEALKRKNSLWKMLASLSGIRQSRRTCRLLRARVRGQGHCHQ